MLESGISNWRSSIDPKAGSRMNKLTLTDLKNHLALKSGEELIQEIAALYEKFPQVRDYYQLQENAEDELARKYNNLIRFRY